MLRTQCIVIFFSLVVLPFTDALLGNQIDWDDFSNNFGTDIAPLLSLFGENPAKQFLSESTSFWDSVLFGIAPIGIITTVVSVIRIYGNSSWKSFIGRAQEPHGLAEVELCSSTSEDVGELWSNGGICRVVGRPKMLVFIFTPPDTSKTEDFYPSGSTKAGKNACASPVCGIQTPKDLLCDLGARGGEEQMEDRQWDDITKHQTTEHHLGFSSYPNLSLTIGIRHRLPMWVAVTLGVVLQLLFFGLTIWFAYFVPGLYDRDEGQKPVHWAFGLTIGGTIALNVGMTLCASLIDQKSCERHFKRNGSCSDLVYWLQPGGQRVGDQLFDAFAYCDTGKYGEVKYITSWRVASDHHAAWWWVAVMVSMLGWIVQFIGLRLVPGAVSLSLLGITVIMSLVRASLRSSRLPATANLLPNLERDVVGGHELDWQALELVLKEDDHPTAQGHNYHKCWHITEEYDFPAEVHKASNLCEKSSVCKWMQERESQGSSKGLLNEAAQALRFRSRLAYLTGEQTQPADQAWSTEICDLSAMLQKAFESSADYMFSKFPLRKEWQRLEEFAWLAKCKTPGGQSGHHKAHNICFHMRKDNGAWVVDRNQLEAALSLWSWSLRQNIKSPRDDKYFGDRGYMNKSIVVATGDESHWQEVLNLWVTQTRLEAPVPVNSAPTLLSLPTETHIFLEKSQSLARGSPKYAPCDTLTGTALTTCRRLYFRSRNSRLQLMAQDLFTIFMNRVATIINPLEEVAYKESTFTDILGRRQAHFFVLLNPLVEAVTKALVDVGVASREEALMSVVPALARQKKLPSIKDVTEALLSRAKSFRQMGELRQSESFLNSLFISGPKGCRNRVLRYLGEVYRADMRLSSSSTGNMSVDMCLVRMQQQVQSLKDKVECMKTDSSDDDVDTARETLQCYENLLLYYESKLKRRGCVTLVLNQNTVGFLLRNTDLDHADKLEMALSMKDEERFSDCDRPELLGLLRLAIDESIPELIEDMWMVDQELIHLEVEVENDLTTSLQLYGTPLWWGIDAHSSSDVISSLVDWPGLQLEHTNDMGVTVLGRAVQMENEEATHLLLQKGANCSKETCRDKDGSHTYPLVTAVANGNLEILKRLLKFGAATDNMVMYKALPHAVRKSTVEFTEALLSYVHDLNDAPYSDYYEMTHRMAQDILPQAILGGNITMVECLKQYGADITTKFQVSCDEMPSDLKPNIQTLLRNLRLYDTQVWTTALAITCTKEEADLEFVQYIVKSGLNVNTEVEGGNALIFAVLADNVEMVQFLLKNGADPSKPVSNVPDFGNALIAACGKRNSRDLQFVETTRPRRRKVLEILLSVCLKVDIDDEVQAGLFETALVAAVRRSESWVVDQLLREGASVNSRVKRGKALYGNALIAAAHLRRVDCLESMLRSGSASVSETLDFCQFPTALDAAKAQYVEEAKRDIQYLEDNGCFRLFHNEDAAPHLGGSGCALPGREHEREVRSNVTVQLLENWAAFERSGGRIPQPSIKDFPKELLHKCWSCRSLAGTT